MKHHTLVLLVLVATVVLTGCGQPGTGAEAAAATVAPVATSWSPAARTKTTGCSSKGGLPDPQCSPGAVDPRVTQANLSTTICSRGYTATVRPPLSVTEAIKRQEMAAYGLTGQRLGDYELDHLLSRAAFNGFRLRYVVDASTT